jgi:arsenite methyltransferase
MVTDRVLKAGRALADAMGIEPGASVLDLDCGTGLLSEQLAHRVGMRGDVLGLDPSPYHMAIAHQRARPNLRFQVGSAFALARFPQGCFNAVVANGLLHTWRDQLTPLRELHRVLKPGGRLGVVTPSKEFPHPVLVVQAAVLAREPYSAYPLLEHDYSVDAQELQALLREAGFTEMCIEQQADVSVHATADAALAFAEACAWGQLLGHLPEAPVDLRARARVDIAAGLERLRTAQGISHKGVRLLAVATKSA